MYHFACILRTWTYRTTTPAYKIYLHYISDRSFPTSRQLLLTPNRALLTYHGSDDIANFDILNVSLTSYDFISPPNTILGTPAAFSTPYTPLRNKPFSSRRNTTHSPPWE